MRHLEQFFVLNDTCPVKMDYSNDEKNFNGVLFVLCISVIFNVLFTVCVLLYLKKKNKISYNDIFYEKPTVIYSMV